MGLLEPFSSSCFIKNCSSYQFLPITLHAKQCSAVTPVLKRLKFEGRQLELGFRDQCECLEVTALIDLDVPILQLVQEGKYPVTMATN